MLKHGNKVLCFDEFFERDVRHELQPLRARSGERSGVKSGGSVPSKHPTGVGSGQKRERHANGENPRSGTENPAPTVWLGRTCSSQREKRSGRGLRVFAQQALDGRGGLGANAQPVLNAVFFELEGALFGERVVGAELLQEASVAGCASVGGTIRRSGSSSGVAHSAPSMSASVSNIGSSFSLRRSASSVGSMRPDRLRNSDRPTRASSCDNDRLTADCEMPRRRAAPIVVPVVMTARSDSNSRSLCRCSVIVRSSPLFDASASQLLDWSMPNCIALSIGNDFSGS